VNQHERVAGSLAKKAAAFFRVSRSSRSWRIFFTQLSELLALGRRQSVAGGFIGSELGSRRIGVPAFRKALALVLVIAGGKLILS
jgi:uncharacterized membrane protein YfcA